MGTELMLHLAEIVILGVPVWWGLLRFMSISKDFPPHRHGQDVRDITYPQGFEPGHIVRLNGGNGGNGK